MSTEDLREEQEANLWAAWRASWKKMRALAKEEFEENLEVVIKALKEAKVTKAVVVYYGGGDSGDFEEPEFFRGKAEPGDGLSAEQEAEINHPIRLRGHTRSNDSEYDNQYLYLYPWHPVPAWQPGCERWTNIEKESLLVTAVFELCCEAVGWAAYHGVGEGTVEIKVEEGILEVEHGEYVQHTEWSTTTYGGGGA